MAARFDQLTSTDDLDTDGLSFDDACNKRGLPMPHYICPTLTTADDFDDELERLNLETARRIAGGGSSGDEDGGERDSTPQKIRGGQYNLRYLRAARAEQAVSRVTANLTDYGLEPPAAAEVAAVVEVSAAAEVSAAGGEAVEVEAVEVQVGRQVGGVKVVEVVVDKVA